MSEASKAARAAMRSKAKRMADGDPHAKVDASSWEPSEPLNTTTKTGARPVRPRIYKHGGTVQGDRAKARGDKLPRQIAEAYANRNMPALNADEFGKGHTGAYKKGGRAHKDMGGSNVPAQRLAFGPVVKGTIGIKTGGKVKGKGGTYFGGTRPTGGRIPRASGGRAKGKTKTNINILIGGGHGQQPQPGAMPGPVRPPVPVPVAPPGAPPQGMPMPMAPQMPPQSMGGQMPPPMMRKNGGRANGGKAEKPKSERPLYDKYWEPNTQPSERGEIMKQVKNTKEGREGWYGKARASGGRLPPKTASSFKDMKASAAGGLGRLEKASIAKKQYGSPP